MIRGLGGKKMAHHGHACPHLYLLSASPLLRLSATIDATCSCLSPPCSAATGSAADPRPAGGPPCQRHPAFALGDTGAWHSLSLSLSQQLIGPLRLAADWRYELGSHRPLALPALRGPSPSGGAAGAAGAAEVEGAGAGPVAAGGGLARAAKWVPGAARGVAGHVSGMRPQLLEVRGGERSRAE